jgi:hypothetical protein
MQPLFVFCVSRLSVVVASNYCTLGCLQLLETADWLARCFVMICAQVLVIAVCKTQLGASVQVQDTVLIISDDHVTKIPYVSATKVLSQSPHGPASGWHGCGPYTSGSNLLVAPGWTRPEVACSYFAQLLPSQNLLTRTLQHHYHAVLLPCKQLTTPTRSTFVACSICMQQHSTFSATRSAQMARPVGIQSMPLFVKPTSGTRNS